MKCPTKNDKRQRRYGSFILTCGVLLAAACGVSAAAGKATAIQALSSARPRPRFALEITHVDHPGQRRKGTPTIVWEDQKESNWYFYLCTDQSGYHSKQLPPSACKLSYEAEGDAVKLTLTIYFGDFDHSDIPATLRGVPHQDFVYTARPGKTIELKDLTRFGLTPVEVKVVSANVKPRTPELISEVHSASLEYVKEDRASYELLVHNNSAKGMISVCVGREVSCGHYGNLKSGEALIPSGGVFRVRISNTPVQIPSVGGTIDSRLPPKITLRAALFDDESFEGDPDYAAALMAGVLAKQYQNVRVLDLLGAIVVDQSMDDAAKISRIRKEVPELSEKVDPELMAQIRSRFPHLSFKGKELVERSAAAVMGAEKSLVLISLGRFERHEPLFELNGGAKVATLADWFRLWRDRRLGLPEPEQ